MKRQPGLISTQLHRAVGDSPTFLNYAVWENSTHFRAAFSHPDFKASLAAYPSSAVASPQLLQKVAISDICVSYDSLGLAVRRQLTGIIDEAIKTAHSNWLSKGPV